MRERVFVSGLVMTIALIAGAGLARAGQTAEPVVAYIITNGSEIVDSLIDAPGNAERGRALYVTGARAGCPACHGVPRAARKTVTAPDLSETRLPGPHLPGPDLSKVGGRLNAGAIRLWIVAPGAIAEDATMPAFYAPGQRDGAEDPLYGGPALTAAEIEDLVAYLATLRNQN
jgi:sulfur-oxidizing protein SoxX